MAKNVFVIGLDDFNLELLRRMPRAREYEFIRLLDFDEIVRAERFRLAESLARAENRLRSFPGPVDAIVGHWDFPSSTVLPILRRKFRLPTPTLEAVLKCEHKYWSRLQQKQVLGEAVPGFAAFDPYDDDPLSGIDLEFPFWIKPIKAHSSHLGFKIQDKGAFHRSLQLIRDKIDIFGEPFNLILDHAELPPEITAVDGYHCIAEEMISAGRQCTLEGYALDGEVAIYGVVDSVREGRYRSSFSRYQYPSRLPRPVRERMIEAATRFIRHVGYDGAAFNAEFYWNETTDRISLLEVNARISQSHCPLFEMVDGSSHHQVMIDVALGERPRFARRQGRYRLAGKFMRRTFEDGIVTRMPTEDDVRRLQATFPEAVVRPIAEHGMRLSDLKMQDSYSFELADIFLGANSQKELRANYRKALDILDFRVSPLADAAAD